MAFTGFKKPENKPQPTQQADGKPSFNFKTSSGFKVRVPRDEQLAIFKSVVIQMLKEGKTDKEILAFANNPSPETRFGSAPISQLETSFFGGIIKYTTEEDRKNALLELDNQSVE